MNTWREKLYGYTGLCILVGLWTPMMWFITSSREYYKMETFEVFKMHWFNILVFFTLCAVTLAAQYGLILISQDLSEFEKMKKDRLARQYGETPDI